MRRILLVVALLAFALATAACGRTIKSADTNPSTSSPPAQQAAPVDPNQEPAEPTFLAEGQTPEDHIKAYFDAYKEGRYEDAFELQPGENKMSQPKDQFVPLRESMPITDYKVGPAREEGDQQMIDVSYDLGQNGSWISSWTFEKQDGKWVALRYRASMGSL